MFNQLLAIDVDARIVNFTEQIKKFARQKPLVLQSPHDFNALSAKPTEIDAIAVSIYQTLDESFLAQFPNLKHISILGSSTKRIPVDYCINNNIKIKAVTEYCDHETAEWVILQTLKFFRESVHPHSCYEKSMGVIGVGAVGRLVAKLALALHMKVYFNASKTDDDLVSFGAQFSSKEDIFAKCHVISFHTPAHLIWLNKKLLDGLAKNVRLINTCMGQISPPGELERFLQERPDVALSMDAIAGLSYKNLGGRHFVDSNPAFLTPESQQRLQKKFFANFIID